MASIGVNATFSIELPRAPRRGDIIVVADFGNARNNEGLAVFMVFADDNLTIQEYAIGDWYTSVVSYNDSTRVLVINVTESAGSSLGGSYKATFIPVHE